MSWVVLSGIWLSGAATVPPPRIRTPSAPAESAAAAETKLPLSGLAPAKLFKDLCRYHYRVSTNSRECQAYIDQGLAFYYSYVWMEAARSFETAAQYDPDCAMAYWGLSRALEKWGKGDHAAALKKAKELMPKADPREQKLILARLQEKGLTDEKIEPDQRRLAAQKTIDELIALHDDDQEAWFARAQLSDAAGAVPYYKALLMINPLHPGATHELVHHYENIRRPALGFVYAERYIESSPGIPHAYHMQAHLATRLGRWEKTTDLSAKAIELQRAYHAYQNVKPADDWQFSHHLEILTISLVHDGRFQEARQIKVESEKAGYKHWLAWFRLHRAEHDWGAIQPIIDHHRKHDKAAAAYYAALRAIDQGEFGRASQEIEVLRQALRTSPKKAATELNFWEAQGLLLCRTGYPEEGLRLLQRAVDKTKDDFQHHAWGNGAYYMEVWGLAGLAAGRWDVAEEGLLEALAHDPGSVRAALGMEALCRRQGRVKEAQRYAELAKRFWKRADAAVFHRLADDIRRSVPSEPPLLSTPQLPQPEVRSGLP